MNTLNKVYSKLNTEKKTELAKHKIELGAIDDLKKLNSLYYKNTDTANSVFFSVFNLL